MLSVVNNDGTTVNGSSLIDEIVREGARRTPAAAPEAEVNCCIAELAHEKDERDAGSWSATVTTNRGR